jgi:hypothetical protein
VSVEDIATPCIRCTDPGLHAGTLHGSPLSCVLQEGACHGLRGRAPAERRPQRAGAGRQARHPQAGGHLPSGRGPQEVQPQQVTIPDSRV